MRKIFCLLLTLVFLYSCQSGTKIPPKLFTREMLAAQLFSVDPGQDTLLQTLHGSEIRIKAGSFPGSENVELEIREAFTPSEMLAAGLTTESNGNLLRSGGMIYINATAGGDSVTLLKPIDVSIPNAFYDSSMQVYKGVEMDSGGVNWTSPEPTDTTPQSRHWEAGKQLFSGKCASCHSIFKPLVGPPLGNVENRWPDRSKLLEWIRNNARLIRSGYPKAVAISRYSPSEMQAFEITEQEFDALLNYIYTEFNKPGNLEAAFSLTDSIEGSEYAPGRYVVSGPPCGLDTFYAPVPKMDQAFLEDEYTFQPGEIQQVATVDTPPSPGYLDDPADRNIAFDDYLPTAGMYDFQVKTFGWYNIDAGMEGYTGTSVVKVWAQINDVVPSDLHVYLFCPERQILSVSNEKENDKYSFNKINGGVPLFPGDNAILFAFGSKEGKIYYGISAFRIQAEQTIVVKVSEGTEETVRKALLSKNMNGIDLGIEKKEKVIRERPCDGVSPAGIDTSKGM